MTKIKVVFLDRDGVINKYPGDREYVTSWKEFRFLPGVKQALRKLSRAGYKIFVISNQAGVIKGVYSQQALDEITQNMIKELTAFNAGLQAVYYCIHRDEDNCNCRKPKIGMIEQALKEHAIPESALKQSFFIGDTIRDIETGKNAGCSTILVFCGKEKPRNKTNWKQSPDFTAQDLREAVDIILSSSGV
jgi:histidinol-phosphate phosphatase family protein